MFKFPRIDVKKTGANILRLRKESKLSVQDLQSIFGFTNPQSIYKWQEGKAVPTIDNLLILATVFDVKIDDILITE